MNGNEESIWKDPTLLSMILGQTGAAMMGPEQQSWQANIGQMVSGLGQSFKMAKALETQRAQERALWDRIIKALGGGGTTETGAEVPKAGSELGTLMAPEERTTIGGFPSHVRRLMGGY